MTTGQPFYLAARWKHDAASRQAYQKALDFIALLGLGLSVFRFQIAPEGDYIVAVVGQHPGEELAGECQQAISLGSKAAVTSLDPDVLYTLMARRADLRTTESEWVQGRYDPGLEVPL